MVCLQPAFLSSSFLPFLPPSLSHSMRLLMCCVIKPVSVLWSKIRPVCFRVHTYGYFCVLTLLRMCVWRCTRPLEGRNILITFIRGPFRAFNLHAGPPVWAGVLIWCWCLFGFSLKTCAAIYCMHLSTCQMAVELPFCLQFISKCLQ